MRAIAFGLLFVGSEIGLRRAIEPVGLWVNFLSLVGTVVCIVGGW